MLAPVPRGALEAAESAERASRWAEQASLGRHVRTDAAHARRAAAPRATDGRSASTAIISVECVQRTPLLAYYGETLAASGRARDAPPPGALPGSDRSVPMVRVTYSRSVKPKELCNNQVAAVIIDSTTKPDDPLFRRSQKLRTRTQNKTQLSILA